MKNRIATLTLGLSILSFSAGAAETQQPDAGIAKLLKSLDYEYEVDEDGDYRLVFSLDGKKEGDAKRSQIVYVRSPVESYGSHKVREIWSPGYRSSTDAFPANVANRLLEDSNDSKLGSWVKQNRYAIFVVKVDADADAEMLDDAMSAAMRSADTMEIELTGGEDEF